MVSPEEFDPDLRREMDESLFNRDPNTETATAAKWIVDIMDELGRDLGVDEITFPTAFGEVELRPELEKIDKSTPFVIDGVSFRGVPEEITETPEFSQQHLIDIEICSRLNAVGVYEVTGWYVTEKYEVSCAGEAIVPIEDRALMEQVRTISPEEVERILRSHRPAVPAIVRLRNLDKELDAFITIISALTTREL